jgi:hypothetical protein
MIDHPPEQCRKLMSKRLLKIIDEIAGKNHKPEVAKR